MRFALSTLNAMVCLPHLGNTAVKSDKVFALVKLLNLGEHHIANGNPVAHTINRHVDMVSQRNANALVEFYFQDALRMVDDFVGGLKIFDQLTLIDIVCAGHAKCVRSS